MPVNARGTGKTGSRVPALFRALSAHSGRFVRWAGPVRAKGDNTPRSAKIARKPAPALANPEFPWTSPCAKTVTPPHELSQAFHRLRWNMSPAR